MTAILQRCNQNEGPHGPVPSSTPNTPARVPLSTREGVAAGEGPQQSSNCPTCVSWKNKSKTVPTSRLVGRGNFRSNPDRGLPEISQHPLPQSHGLCGSSPPEMVYKLGVKVGVSMGRALD